MKRLTLVVVLLMMSGAANALERRPVTMEDLERQLIRLESMIQNQNVQKQQERDSIVRYESCQKRCDDREEREFAPYPRDIRTSDDPMVKEIFQRAWDCRKKCDTIRPPGQQPAC